MKRIRAAGPGRRWSRTCCAILVLSIPAVAFAEKPDIAVNIRYSAEYTQCMRGANNDQIFQCVDEELANWTARLNRTYRRVLAALPAGDRARAELQLAQRRWLAFLPANCEADADIVAEGGSMHNNEYMSCSLEQTAQRVIYLERYAVYRSR